jgi:PST family polysaccharide transporter
MLNVDYVIVGRELGTVQLGFYMLAFNLSSFPWNMLSTAVRPVAVPGFARYQHDQEQLVAVFRRWFHMLMVATVPICALLGTLALPLITVVYGAKWQDAAPVLVFLAALGGLRVAIDFCYDLFVAVGESRLLMRIQAVWLLALIPALTIGAREDGLRGVGIAHAAVATLLIVPAYLLALRRRHGIPVRSVLSSAARPLLGGAAAVLVGIAVGSLLDSSWSQLLGAGAAMMLVYVVVGVSRRELRAYPRQLLGRRAAAAA